MMFTPRGAYGTFFRKTFKNFAMLDIVQKLRIVTI